MSRLSVQFLTSMQRSTHRKNFPLERSSNVG
jgi:hypothetical protein